MWGGRGRGGRLPDRSGIGECGRGGRLPDRTVTGECGRGGRLPDRSGTGECGRERGLPDRHTLFATGTACIQAIPSSADIQARRSTRLPSRPKIHLPSFYCMTVVNALAGQFEICWYHDVPNEPGPDLQSIKVENGDYILILNSFGVRTQDAWAPWIAQHPSVVTVEDHSHDPFSAWAQSSTADFAFASLRKTLPIPDGGLLYSPKGLSLPRPQSGESIGATKRLVIAQG